MMLSYLNLLVQKMNYQINIAGTEFAARELNSSILKNHDVVDLCYLYLNALNMGETLFVD